MHPANVMTLSLFLLAGLSLNGIGATSESPEGPDLPGAVSVDGVRDDVSPARAYEDGFRWDFAGWERDLDDDRLDDLIAAVAQDGLDALPRHADGFMPFSARQTEAGPLLDLKVAYDVGVGPSDLDLLLRLGLQDVIVDEIWPLAFVVGATPAQANAVSGAPGVVMVELQPVYRALNDVSRKASQVDQSSAYSDTVWQTLGFRGDGVGIAILDTGVDDEHESLAGSFVAGADAAAVCGAGRALEVNPDDDNTVVVDPFSLGFAVLTQHGTHVAGTALGRGMPGTGALAGMAPEADLYDVKVLTGVGFSCLNSVTLGLNFVYNFNIGATITWQHPLSPMQVPATKRIDVVSLSLGGACSDGTDSLSQSLDWTVTFADVVAVAAVGNNAVQRSSGVGCITSPSAAEKAISVGAYDDMDTPDRSDDDVAWFSNCGPSVSPPNSDQKKPDVTAPGVAIRSAMGSPTYQGIGLTNAYRFQSGTSMATPAVAGIAALMIEKDATQTPADVKQTLREEADHKTSGNGYTIAASGSDPAYHTCWGFGAANAYDAVLNF